MTEPSERQRAERSDKGQVRVTERDLMIFHWLATMKAVYEPDLGVLIERMTGARPGDPAVRALTRRWRQAELADARKLLATKPRIVRLLSGGGHLVGETYFKPTAEFTQYHQAETARVRLHLEGTPSQRHGKVIAWESEREYRQYVAETEGKVKSEHHIPDGIATFEDGTRAAIEVERSVKNQERLRAILNKTLTVYPEVIYAIPPDPRELARSGKLEPQPEIATAVRTAHRSITDQHETRGTRLGALRMIAIPEEVN